MASRVSLIQSRSIYVGTSNSVAPSDGNLIVTGNVGIGTTSPTTTLDVRTDSGVLIKGASSDIDGRIALVPASGGRQYGLRNYGSSFGIKDESADVIRMYFHYDGNTGIGTTSPNSKLDVRRTSSGIAAEFISTAGTLDEYIDLKLISGNDAAGTYGTILRHQRIGSSGADFAILTNPTLTGTPVERMRITKDGSVGIGTTSPFGTAANRTVLSVNGTTDVSLNVGTSGAQRAYLYGSSTYAELGTIGALPLTLATDNNEKMRITSAGNVGIGTTNPGSRLDIKSPSGDGVDIIRVLADTTGTSIFRVYATTGIGDGLASVFDSSGTERVRLYSNGDSYFTGGNVGIGTTSPARPLHVNGIIQWGGTSSAPYAYSGIDGSGLYIEQVDDNTFKGKIRLQTRTNNTGSYTRFSIDADNTRFTFETGDVGIGTTSPSTNLHVAGSVRVTGDRIDVNSNTRITGAYYENSNTEYTYIDMYNGGDASINIGTKHPLSYISFESGNGAYTERMRITNTGNVGIGTTTPDYKFEVEGVISSCDAALQKATFANVGSDLVLTANAGATNVTAKILFNSSGAGGASVSTKMIIDGSGNVGIGTTSPTVPLQIVKDNATISMTNSSAFAVDTGSRIFLGGKYDTAGTTTPFAWLVGAKENATDGNQAGYLSFTTVENGGGFAERMRITSDGDVAINSTITSGYKLYVNGSTWINGGTNFQDGVSIFRTQSGAAEVMRIASNGNVGIGTTSPSAKLHVVGTGYFTSFVGIATGTTSSWGLAVGTPVGADGAIKTTGSVQINSGALAVGSIPPSATAGRIDASNDIVAYSTSDSRLKENITPIANALDKVKSLTGVEFDWKEETKDVHGYEGHDVGVIAQDVQAVLPEAVRTNDSGYLSVRYEKMIALLIEANKELANRVELLEQKLKQQ